MSDMIGNKNGIKLWNMMSTSDDPDEQSNFQRLNAAATKYGQVWFCDIVTQRETGKNQVVWHLLWNAVKSIWEVSKFHAPVDAKEITPRMEESEEIIEIDVNDLILD